jgi:hypothetical protein
MSFFPQIRHFRARRTIVDGLLLLHLCFVAVQYCAQTLADLVHDTFASCIELGKVVCLLHQRVEGADLEVGYRKGGRVAAI